MEPSSDEGPLGFLHDFTNNNLGVCVSHVVLIFSPKELWSCDLESFSLLLSFLQMNMELKFCFSGEGGTEVLFLWGGVD